jgi:hypothetical protein
MTDFNDQVTVRFGALDLVRGEWRRLTKYARFCTMADSYKPRCFSSKCPRK